MRRVHRPSFALFSASALLALAGLSCGGGGGSSGGGSSSTGEFKVLSTNMADSDIWNLNRPILLRFNHPVDADSVGFGSIILRPVSPEVQGIPVTGEFELLPGEDDKIVVFYPACPTNEDFSNGAFVPGGYRYEMVLPTQGSFGSSVLRDSDGRQLSVGLSRVFFTPTPPSDPLFIDTAAGPPLLTTVEWPEGLNLFTSPDSTIVAQFNQPVDASPSNFNSDKLQVLYAEGEIGTALENAFDDENRVPGTLLLAENCGRGGSVVFFQVAGVLPANRKIRFVVRNDFADLSGETNSVDQFRELGLPSLADVYGDPGFDEEDEAVDEIQHFFDNTQVLDPQAGLQFPPAELVDGTVRAAFDFPGVAVPEDADFVLDNNLFLELQTDGTTTITDSFGRIFTVEAGVLYVDDLTIASGSGLRGRGSNPLVIYATGTVNIGGVLDVSGNNAKTPVALNAPTIPEPGALGECGGGAGGTASQETTKETNRGLSGNGPFGAVGGGGQGGEGAIINHQAFALFGGADELNVVIRHCMAGGGAGGTFAATLNQAIFWNRWTNEANPAGFDNAGPDFQSTKHTQLDPTGLVSGKVSPPEMNFYGGEHGLRGSSWNSDALDPFNVTLNPTGVGCYGMEDLQRDVGTASNGGPNEELQGFDPAFSTGTVPPFRFGNPSLGPDGGFTNLSLFGDDGLTRDDFFGTRFNTDGTVTQGQLLAPWAGYGGGASGDTSVILRLDLDGDSFADPLNNFYPDTEFPNGTTVEYLKGAPGGGGGGQLQVLAVGTIIIGPNARISANGGIGNGGESVWLTNNQVSGSGGGSGGHVVLVSATGLDLSALNVGTGGNPFNPNNLTDVEVIQALGGRRGWAGSSQNTFSGDPGGDGNSDFMTGRGGAGSNGVITVAVPEPGLDIVWPASASSGIKTYIGTPVNTDRLEEVLEAFSVPAPFALVPAFATKSQVQSDWIDTGLAGLRDPANGSSSAYPNYDSSLLNFEGVATSGATAGMVLTSSGMVTAGEVIASGSVPANLQDHQLVIGGAGTLFDDEYTRTPRLLVGYDLYPNSAVTAGFEVVAASYDRAQDKLTLTTRTTDGDMTAVAGATWTLREKFFRVDTAGTKDSLPDSGSVRFEFQGASESFEGSGVPGTPTAWTSDLALLVGKRFVRYRVTFDVDAQGTGSGLSNVRPALDYVKIPFVF